MKFVTTTTTKTYDASKNIMNSAEEENKQKQMSYLSIDLKSGFDSSSVEENHTSKSFSVPSKKWWSPAVAMASLQIRFTNWVKVTYYLNNLYGKLLAALHAVILHH